MEEEVRFFRVNGFSLAYDKGAILRGRIPLTLARKIRNTTDTKEFSISFGGSNTEQPDEWATNVDLADMLSEAVRNIRINRDAADAYNEKRAEYIKQAEQKGKLDDIYVLKVYVDTTKGLIHIIRTIRESGYINQCIWDS